MTSKFFGRGAVLVSVAAHAALLSLQVEASPAPSARMPPAQVEFSLLEPEVSADEVEPDPAAAREPEPPPPVLRKAPAPPELEAPSRVASDSKESEPLEPSAPELTGTTLTAEGPSLFEAPPGSGRARRGAFRSGVSRPIPLSPKPRAAPKKSPHAGVAIVPLAELSRLPVPPDLGRALEKNYPPVARRQGKAGEAKVRALVEPTGKIRRTQILLESDATFGSACRKTLLESRWGRPRDARGRPVATWVSYRCRFRIDG